MNRIAKPDIVSSGFLFFVRVTKKSKKCFEKLSWNFLKFVAFFSIFITPAISIYFGSQNMSKDIYFVSLFSSAAFWAEARSSAILAFLPNNERR